MLLSLPPLNEEGSAGYSSIRGAQGRSRGSGKNGDRDLLDLASLGPPLALDDAEGPDLGRIRGERDDHVGHVLAGETHVGRRRVGLCVRVAVEHTPQIPALLVEHVVDRELFRGLERVAHRALRGVGHLEDPHALPGLRGEHPAGLVRTPLDAVLNHLLDELARDSELVAQAVTSIRPRPSINEPMTAASVTPRARSSSMSAGVRSAGTAIRRPPEVCASNNTANLLSLSPCASTKPSSAARFLLLPAGRTPDSTRS